jgi:hypothetical protein
MSLTQTRRSWHGIAELVLAGPQVRATGHLRLRVVPGGFATAHQPDLRVERHELVDGDVRVGIDGRTCAELAAAVGVELGAPAGRYPDGSGVRPDEVLRCDATAAEHLARCFATGDDVLRRFAGQAQPPLWPEHFDVGLSVDEVNYGVSPGDEHIDEPYAYVGPWRRRSGEFWNQDFGAARPLRQLGGAAAVLAFFEEGRRRATTDAPADA